MSSPQPVSAQTGVLGRISRYEQVLDSLSQETDSHRALEAMAVATAAEPDAIGWYYRGVALARLGQHQDALEAFAIAADLGPADKTLPRVTTTRPTPVVAPAAARAPVVAPVAEPEPASTLRGVEVDVIEVIEILPTDVGPAPSPVCNPIREPVAAVTVAGPAKRDLSMSGMFLAVNLDASPVPPRPPAPVPHDTQPSAVVEALVEAEPQPEPEPEVEPEPENLDTAGWYFRGVTLARKERFEQAVAAYTRATQLDPHNIAAWQYKGITLARMGRHRDAIASYTGAIELDPRNPAVWINMAVSLEKLERPEQAARARAQARELDASTRRGWRARVRRSA